MVRQLKGLKSDIEKIAKFCNLNGKPLYISLSSSIELNTSPYIGGIRDLREFLLVSIVNLSQSLLKNLSVTIEKYASVLFVDVEKKHPFEVSKQDIEGPVLSNLISASTQLIPNIPIIGWSPSRATCDATLKSIKKDIGENIGGQKISIIGLGNIGFKLALALVEEGCDVVCYSRDRNKLSSLVEAINYLKSSYTIASASCARNPEIALAASKIIILSASSRNFINEEQLKLLSSNSRIYDVGKDSLTLDAKTLIETRADIKHKRVDVGTVLIGLCYLHHYKHNFEHFSSPLAKNIEREVRLISGGYPGKEGDIIVDNANDPKFVLGNINKDGKYIRNLEYYDDCKHYYSDHFIKSD